MQQENVGPHELSGVMIDYIDVAPAFATTNAVVWVNGKGYLFTGDGAQNMICSLIMAHAMKYPVNFTANGYQDAHGYGYVTKVTIGDAS